MYSLMFFVWWLPIVLLTSVILKTYLYKKKFSKFVDILPGDNYYPIIGTSWKMLKAGRECLFDVISARHKKFGPIFRSWNGSAPMIHIYKPEHAQIILRSNVSITKGTAYKYLHDWLGKGLISGSGPKWKEHRRLITPSFHFNILDSYGEIFAKKSLAFVKHLEKYSNQGYFDITSDLSKVSLDIITETAMGVKMNCLEGNDIGVKYADSVNFYCNSVMKRYLNPLYQNGLIFRLTEIGQKCLESRNYILDFNKHVIRTRKELYQKKKSNLPEVDDLGRKTKISFLDLLLSYAEKGLTEEEIQEEVSTFMFAGFDTTVASVSYTLLELGNRPDILECVHAELDSIFMDDPDRSVTTADLNQMTYLDMVVKEVLRKYAFVPSIQRRLEEDIQIENYHIPKGVVVTISLYDLHHDPDHFPEPFKFDPDRFLPENVAKRHPYAFVPFSAGPRNCLGQKFGMRNVKTLLATVLRKFNVTSRYEYEQIKYYYEVVLRPQNGVEIALEPRK
ncbi:hypothetical protein ABEB36_007340 [Hypothenemus hampei]|uniref:Cytochrome P450 n=1 Tax=Hypothenemus hampei TaxID=57062 RepID=A0ABD1ETP7_HYPHA